MLVGTSGVTAPPEAAAAPPIDELKSSDPTLIAGGGGASALGEDRFTRSDPALNPNAYHEAIASLSPAVTPANDVATPAAGVARAGASSSHVIADHAGKYEDVANGKLPPSSTIQENGYTFTTDAQGRVSSASGQLSVNANASARRSSATESAQKQVGWEDRLPDDHGGHLVANRFNGPGDIKNLFAQNGNFNLGEYKKLENGWAKSLDQGHAVKVNVELSYPKGSLRPDHVSVSTRIDSGPKIYNHFDNAPGGKASAETHLAADGAEDAAKASKLARGLEVVGKVAVPVAIAADGYSLYGAYKQDGDRIGSHTVEQAGSVAGGWAGAAVGAEAGAEGGAAIGALFGGVGAAPGAVIGGVVGGVVGGVAGSDVGKTAVKLGEDGVDLGKKAVKGIAHFFGL